jgi:2-methylcitrate dehydratase PrpD
MPRRQFQGCYRVVSKQASNFISALAARISGLKCNDIGVPTIEALRLHALDTLAAWIAATTTTEGKALIAFRDNLCAFEGATAGTSKLFDDVATNCALARLSEVDDIHLASMMTPGAVVIPAAVTLTAELEVIDAGDFAVATLAGYEAMIRLGLVIKGPDALVRGIWPTYFAAPFGAAAMAARLLRMNEIQTAHALALALTMAAPSVGQHRAATAARWLSIGNAVRNGLTAALAARSGFTGDVDFIESRLLADVFGTDPAATPMAPTDDAPFLLTEVSFKPWWGARQTMAAAQAMRELTADRVAVSDAQEIVASVPPPHLRMVDHGVVPGDRNSYMTSLPYQMAIAVLQPKTMLDIDPSASPESDALHSLMARIKVRPDERLLADYPKAWPARVVVTTAQGMVERFVRHIPGDSDPAFAFTEVELSRKFRALVAPMLGEIESQRVWEFGSAACQAGPGSATPIRQLNGILARTTRHAPNG